MLNSFGAFPVSNIQSPISNPTVHIMAIESKIRRPVPFGAREDMPSEPPKKKGPIGKFLWFLFIVALILAGYYVAKTYLFTGGSDVLDDLAADEGQAALTLEGEYSALFLDNGQVYFGQLKDNDGDFYVLEDVYYLESRGVQGSTTGESSLSIVKLGSEAHGPEDRMEINRDHILFIEAMTPESKVMQAIAQDK